MSHLDREVEFHDLLEAVDAICTYLPVQQTDSCEQMASTLIDRLDAIWHDRVWTVTVDEDGNCGATVHESREPF